MPFCPICAEEYEERIVRCADCGAALVEESPEADDETNPREPEELIRSRDTELIDAAVKYLAHHGIASEAAAVPAQDGIDGGFVLVVCAAAWTVAVETLGPFLDSWPLRDQPDVKDELPESLARSLREIIDDGQDMLADLAKAVLAGNRQAQTKAGYALLQMGEPALVLLVELLVDAVEADDVERVKRICRVLAEFRDPETIRTVLQLLGRSRHVRAAVVALGYLDDTRAVPKLVELLEHNDEAVRDEAAESLYNITDKTFDFEAADPPELRRSAVEQWTDWMRGRGLA